jgi:hypothetical protein
MIVEVLIILILYALLASAVAAFAERRGRNRIGWFLVSLLLSPLIGFLLVAGSRDLKPKLIIEPRAPCPQCAEQILPAARICPHCHSTLDSGWSSKRRYLSRPA